MPESENPQKPERKVSVRMEYTPSVNYAMSLNGVRYFDYCNVTNEEAADWANVHLKLSGEYVETSEVALDTVPAGQTVQVRELEIKPDADKLSQLTEALQTKLHLDITMKEGDGETLLWQADYDLRLLAFDEWPGIDILPEMLAAFVTPNDPAVARVNVAAAAFLEKLTGSSALDEYQTRDPNRVRAMVAAIFEALRSEKIVYCAPPASFERSGQRIRLVEKVLTEKLGTCLDTTLLFASCLEAAGIHPLVVLMNGHAFVGAWLVDSRYSQMTGDDSSFLLKASADGINEIVLVETTDITASGDVTFEQAAGHAENKLRGAESDFRLFIDVARCRLNGVRPLPARVDGKWQTAGVAHTNVTREVAERETINVDMNVDESKLTRQQIWERKLLDFSLRNNLINIRVGRRIIPFVSYNIDRLEDMLQAGEDYQLLPTPVKKVEPGEFGIYDSSLYRAEMEQLVTDGLEHRQLISYLTEEELKAAETGIFRASRTAIEENGANSLFLVLGLMKWFETEKSVRPRYAPILLLPVDIIRKGSNNYVLRTRDEDIILNTTLVEMLKQQFDIHLSGLDPLPVDDSGADVKKVFATVRTHLKDHKGWDVLEESMLGLFSFNKFVMWNDIHNNADKMRQNPIINSLIEKRITWQDQTLNIDSRDIDKNVEPGEFAIPMDVDSSQMEAVIESGEGKSFILYGPPGTGKSQTITNMIANALFHDKRVLFVAEKMAALSVVQKRLTKIGVEPFCLEMHSNKATKTHLLDQLDMALNVTHIKTPEEFGSASKNLYDQRQKLIGYMEALHRQHGSGLSLYDCITRYIAIDGDEVKVDAAQLDKFNDAYVQQVAEEVEGLDTVFRITGHPAAHPLRGLNVKNVSVEAQGKMPALLQAVKAALLPASQAVSRFAAAYGQADEQTTVQALRIIDQIARWREVIALQAAADKQHKEIASVYTDKIFGRNAAQMETAWQEVKAKWFLPRFFAKRNFVADLKQFNPYMKAAQVDGLISSLKNDEQQHAAVTEKARQLAAEVGVSASQILAAGDAEQATLQQISTAAATLQQALNNAAPVFDFDTADLAAIGKTIESATANLDKVRDWSQWCTRKTQLMQQHAGPAVDYIIENNASGHEASLALCKGVYHQLALKCIDAEPSLQLFNGLLFEDQIKKYRELAANFQTLTKKMLYYHLASRIPSLTIEAANTSEVGILKRYIASKGRGATIRKIIDQIPTLLPKLCPCVLMSPLSVAQYIDLAQQDKFDLVVFDEASQMPTSEAVGAIARGKNLIVVGDPKQMPPTSFFSTTQVDEEEAENDDMESILDDCITLSFPSRYLTWHYRSKHESLIAFSNQEYYDGKLFTFPSVDDRVSKVTLRHVDGTYDYGRTRSNRQEAEAITEEVIRRLRLPDDQQHSIGIVAFSKVQMNLIEDVLTEELAKHPELESKAYGVEEPIFIKNLENVQGDERDIILFSVGYGPDKSGKVSMNFGPLNNAGGERRLNVAVSRARYEMVVFSTLEPEQIDLRRTKAKGVEGLKNFLEFAERGRLSVNPMQAKPNEESDLINDLAVELGKQGYEVDKLVGRSQFKIDLAVIDPHNKDTYMMGILTDGKHYYETKTERDREICQPNVLRMLNWNVMKVWSVDWFENRQAVVERIVKALKDIQEGKPAGEQPIPKSAAFSVEQEPVEIAVNEHQQDYVVADDPKITRQGDMDYVLTQGRNVATELRHIVEVEQPVTAGYLAKRIVKIWGLTRVTPRLQTFVSRQLDTFAYRDLTTDLENPCFWLSPEAANGYDKYRVNSGRDITDIPLIELMNAMHYAVEQQISVSAEDLKRQVAQLLGFARKGAKIGEAADKALQNLLDAGTLREADGMVSLVPQQ